MKASIVRLLRWSERYTRTDMVYLAKNSSWVFLGQLATSLSAFIVMVALANMVDKGEYGEYRFIIAIILILAIFTLPGMQTALVQSTARGHEGQLDTIVRVRIKWGLLATFFAWLLSAYYFYQANTSLGYSFAIVGAFMPLYGVYFSYFFYLQGKQLFDQAALTQAAARVIFMIVMIGTAFIAPTATYLIAAYMIATIAMQYAGYLWTKKHHRYPQNIDGDAIAYGKYLTLYNATPNTIATQIGIVAIWYFMGDVEAAVYAVAMMIPMEFNRLGSIFNQVATPRMSQKEIDVPALFRKIFKFELVLIATWLLYALLAPYIFALFFPTYSEAVDFSILAMLMVLLVPRMVLRGYLNAKKMRQAIRTVSLSVPILQIILTLTLIPALGIMGAILALLIAWSLEYLLMIYFTHQST
ncbi:MAG: oligosaccharide flippase family protein [Patescibacteria group bacterium]